MLVVDDDPLIRCLLRDFLEEDYDIRDATNSTTTAEACRLGKLDAILLDLRLPDADGLTLLARLRALRPGLPVIVVTGVDSVEVAVSAMKLGAADYLTKPIHRADLLEAVKRVTTRPTPVPFSASRSQPSFSSILLVGSDVPTLAVLAALLEGKRSVRIAATLFQAIPYVAERPALVVIDGEIADLEGMAFLKNLRDASPDCVLILATDTTPAGHSHIPPPDRVAAVLRKPYRLADMLATLTLNAKGYLERPLPSNPHVIDALEYVRRTPIRNTRTRRIARSIGVSPGHLAHLFRSHAGTTIDRILARVRVALTEQFMLDPDRKLDAVAELAGFSDAAHLSRTFKRYRGICPGEYRRWRRHLSAGES